MKKVLILIVILMVVIMGGVGIWYYYFCKKSPEGSSCFNSNQCKTGLNCIKNKCSSGSKDSLCNNKNDCKTAFCARNVCTEGKQGDLCTTGNDCQENLLCKNSVCTAKTDYTKYFESITISKIKAGMPPGPTNKPIETDEFKSTDAIEIDLVVKADVVGSFYAEVTDPVTGLSIFKNETREITQSGPMGTGFVLPTSTKPGNYELDIYFDNELVYNVAIKVI